jgi:predicted small secreted protein
MKNPIINRILAFLFALVVVVAFSGCKTAKGAGEDLEDLGEEIQDSAD